MCWFGLNKSIVAEKNIKVFKICLKKKGKILSYYNEFVYEVGAEYSATFGIRIKDFGRIAIYEGLHSYSSDCCLKIYKEGIYCDWFGRGEPIVKVDCIIPKGAIYYENEKGEIVSNRLEIVSVQDVDFIDNSLLVVMPKSK